VLASVYESQRSKALTLMQGQVEQVAKTVVERAAEVLCTRVSVIDDRGIVITSSESACTGLPFDLVHDPAANYVRVPLRFGPQAPEVIVDEPLNGEVIPPRLAQVLVDLIINQTAVLDRLPNQHELKNKFIHDLLHDPITNEQAMLREAQILGMDFAPPRAVILINAAEYIFAPGHSHRPELAEARIRRRAQLVIASVVGFFDLPNDTICAYIGDGEVVVLKASSRQDLVAWTDGVGHQQQLSPSWADLAALKRASSALLTRLRRDTGAAISVGIGRYHPGIRGLTRSYQDARAALSLGCRFHGENQVHCLDGLGIAAFVGVADEGTKIDLATHLLSPLDHAEELLETLDIFFSENCCPSSTANRLSIHRNTLSYRLAKTTSLTGLDPRQFDDAVQIRLAFLLRSLRSARS
jgi:carbohydrate diacid regulator